MKETTEFLEALAGTVNSAFQAAEDGKIGVEDLAYFFDDIGRWQAGVKDLTFAQEATRSTAATTEAAFAAAAKQMTNVSPEVAYNMTAFLKGMYCAYRLGVSQGRAQALAESENKKTTTP